MLNRIAFTLFYLFIVVGFYLSCPYQWKENKTKHHILLSFGCIGFIFIFLLINAYRYINNDVIKKIIIYGEASCYGIMTTSIVVNVVKRYILQACINRNNFKFLEIIDKERINVIFITIFATIYLVLGFYNINNLTITNYDVTLNKGNNHCKVGFIADLHLGSGLQKEDINELIELINKENIQVLLIGGDIIDSSTSFSDLECLKTCLKALKLPMYYVIGNHELDSVYDYKTFLDECGVVILSDEVVTLDDNLVLIGRDLKLKKSVDEIIGNDISDNNSYIILQHDPSKLNEINLNNSLVISGHTHGYQFPYMNPSALFFKIEYGRGKVNQSEVIVSSGVSVWGHHCTFPSKNEIVILEVAY